MAGTRSCQQCGGAMPSRMHRQTNEAGQKVCEECKRMGLPPWSTAHSSLDVVAQSEMRRREAEALVSISKVRRNQRESFNKEAHDSGDNAIVSHCPFCGGGAIVAGSDGSISCSFCHSSFSVQVQPNHPFMPQTVDGQPITPPGMPGGEETEMSSPTDPATEDPNQPAPVDPSAPPSAQPAQPGQPPAKTPAPGAKPNPFAKKDPADKASPDKADDSGAPKKKSLPPWLKKKTLRTSTGASLSVDDYVAHLALAEATDRDSVLDAVRLNRTASAVAAKQAAGEVECPECGGSGSVQDGPRDLSTGITDGKECPLCDGEGTVYYSTYQSWIGEQGDHQASAAGDKPTYLIRRTRNQDQDQTPRTSVAHIESPGISGQSWCGKKVGQYANTWRTPNLPENQKVCPDCEKRASTNSPASWKKY